MAKKYVKNIYSTDNKGLFMALEEMKKFKEKGQKNKSIELNKIITNSIRKKLKTNCIIGLAENKEHAKILILVYDIEANDDNFYSQYFDKEKQSFYIEVSE